MGTATKTLQYRYDSRGNRSALIDHDGGRFTYSYDSVNRITQVQNPQGDRTSYSYDAGGRRTLKKLSNGTRASFTYDAVSNLTKLYNLKSDGTVISSFDYTYDKVGNRTAVLEADGSRVTWSYDDGYQLTGEHRTGSTAYRDTFTYDASGNRLLKNHDGARTTYAYDATNQLVYSQDVSGRTTFTFDADGNQQVVREPSGNRTTYAWDYENRMTSVRLPSGIRNTMAYDADGLRVKLEESTGTKKFVWDDQNYLGETDANNDTQVIYTNEPRLYGNLISQRRLTGGIWVPHWYHFDALGSTRQLTDNSAVVSDTRLYDAWGNAIVTTGSTVTPLRWVGDVGYYFDAQIGLYYVRARVYHPMIARWCSMDPIGLEGGDANLYRYIVNHPITRSDPSGLLWPRTTCVKGGLARTGEWTYLPPAGGMIGDFGPLSPSINPLNFTSAPAATLLCRRYRLVYHFYTCTRTWGLWFPYTWVETRASVETECAVYTVGGLGYCGCIQMGSWSAPVPIDFVPFDITIKTNWLNQAALENAESCCRGAGDTNQLVWRSCK